MKPLLLFFTLISFLSSCSVSEKITYFQDMKPNEVFTQTQGREIRVQPDDMLSIVVSSKNPELASIFNLMRVQQQAGSLTSISGGQNTMEGYTVNSKGDIDMPVLGSVHIEGLTKEEIAHKIKHELIAQELLKDPVVTVNFLNLQFSVLGEVTRPGQYNITKNKTTLLEALSMAGDLSIYGKRDRVFLTREAENGQNITYQLDLRTKEIYQSPAFYVQQNDMIYIEPNKIRANQSTVNGNTVRSATFWMSLASFLTSITVLIAK